jgi:hypothetical protein
VTTFKLTAPATVYTVAGHTTSNTFFGSSMLFGNVYRKVRLPEGALLFDWPGGSFALVRGKLIEVTAEITTKHPFEKSYGGRPTFEATWRHVQKVQVADPTDTPRVTRGEQRFSNPVPKATLCANGVDWLLRGGR